MFNCFGTNDSPAPSQDVPNTLPPRAGRARRQRRYGSLTALLGPLTPTSPHSSQSLRSSWSPNQRPIISRPISETWLPLTPNASAPASPLAGPGQTMASEHLLAPPSFVAEGRLKQRREAEEMTKLVLARAKRTGLQVPTYELLELIGKGSFGRVFKSRRGTDAAIVAVKIVDVDSLDYKLDAKEKDQAITDFINEIKVLQTLKDQQAKNINLIHEAFPFHSQLWIVSEYCPGGSVHTLMKAAMESGGLEEKYIVPISRELAVALKHVHEAGIIHRDVKAANILVTQDGRVQLCDFGVSGILETNAAKRSTIIGTPFWMAPEMHQAEIPNGGYGTEIDCWAYGCTVYELATGLPPNARIAPQRLNLFLKKAPRLEGDRYSAALQKFVSYCLEERPENRPTAARILEHSYIANTEKTHPTASLTQLIDRYAQWEQSGGQRKSLFNAYGARAPSMDSALEEDNDWNFSTTDDFARNLKSRLEGKEPESLARADEIQRAARGDSFSGWSSDSDLPLRSLGPTNPSNRETIIDLDMADDFTDQHNLDLADIPTIRANRNNRFYEDEPEDEPEFWPHRESLKRATKEWTYPARPTLPEHGSMRPRTQDWSFAKATQDAASQSADESSSLRTPQFRPTLKHTTTEPVGNFNDFIHAPPGMLSSDPPDRGSMIDLDEAYASSTAESVYTDFTTDGEAFDLDSGGNTIKRESTHAHSLSESSAQRQSQEIQSHGRGGSISSDSGMELHSRAISVKESVEELRHGENADRFWEDDYLSYPQGLVQDFRDQRRSLLSRPGRASSQKWNSFDSTNPTSPIDPDLPELLASQARHPQPNLSGSSSSTRERSDNDRTTPPNLKGSSSMSFTQHLQQQQHHQQSRRRLGNYSRNHYKSYDRYDMTKQSANPIRANVHAHFPAPTAPNPAALDDDAEPVVVIGELERLLDDFLTGLRVTSNYVSGEYEMADGLKRSQGGTGSEAEALDG